MTRDTADHAAPGHLSSARLFTLSAAGAVLIANAYYIHPIVTPVAAEFGVGAARIGLVPALNQLALALGILLLLPLGDRVPNRILVLIFSGGQLAAVATMALARDFFVFTAASTLLGFSSIGPYLLPTYVSKRVAAANLGRVTAVMTTGVIAGILVARSGGGVIAQHAGWRAVYLTATVLMAAACIALACAMDDEPPPASGDPISYPALLRSMVGIVRGHPEILLTGAIQALNFGIFLVVWLGLGLYLPALGYGVDAVGYLALLAAVNLVLTPRFGRMIDGFGARRARSWCLAAQFAAVLMLAPLGGDLRLLAIPLLVMTMSSPLIDITNRMTFLNQMPAVRTRLMTVYIVLMFAGAGLASWAGTAAYAWRGWPAVAILAALMSGTAVLMAWITARR